MHFQADQWHKRFTTLVVFYGYDLFIPVLVYLQQKHNRFDKMHVCWIFLTVAAKKICFCFGKKLYHILVSSFSGYVRKTALWKWKMGCSSLLTTLLYYQNHVRANEQFPVFTVNTAKNELEIFVKSYTRIPKI